MIEENVVLPERVVLRANELFHDFEGADYAGRHPEIFEHEVQRWKKIARHFFAHESPVRLLDVGSGTGFIPLTIGEFFTKQDTIICSDLSATMLDICRQNLMQAGLSPRFEFLKLTGGEFDVERGSVDIVTLNSVLHHVPALESFTQYVEAVLRPNGVVVIGHEPNHRFFNHRFLALNQAILGKIVNAPAQFKRIARRTVNRNGSSQAMPPGSKQAIYQRINACLVEESLVDEPLPEWMIAAAIDYYSPSAGKVQRGKGFDVLEFGRSLFPHFEVLFLDTYAHCGKTSERNVVTRSYSALLRSAFPSSGAVFFTVLRRKS